MTARSATDRAVDTAGLGLVAALGATLLWWPQRGDQALFQLGGSQLAGGSVYWRDFWDVKQPGIFWFYALSERFGGAVLGVRLLELAAALLAAIVVQRVAASWQVRPPVRLLAPALVLGPYLLAGPANGVGQVEGLVTLPLLAQYACLRAAWTTSSPRAASGWAAAAGLAGVAVATFKLLYAPLAVVLAVGVWVELGTRGGLGRTRGESGRRARRLAAGWLAGAGAAGFAVLAYFAAHAALPLAAYSTFQAPREQLATGLFSTRTALSAVRALLLSATLTGPLALVSVASAVRRRQARRELVLVAWAVAAAVLAAPQLPTTYRQLVLLPPIGLLAVLGLDRVLDLAADRPRRVRAALAAVLVVAALPLAAPLVTLTRALAADGPALDLGDARRLAVGDRIGGSPMVGPAAVMRSTIPPGTAIYVLGDPVVYRVLGARQAIEMNGWGPEIMSPRMWSETLRELRRSRPEWVFVEQDYQSYIDRAPGVTAFLSQAYTATTPLGAEGVWWHTATPGRPAPSVEGNLLARG